MVKQIIGSAILIFGLMGLFVFIEISDIFGLIFYSIVACIGCVILIIGIKNKRKWNKVLTNMYALYRANQEINVNKLCSEYDLDSKTVLKIIEFAKRKDLIPSDMVIH